MPALDDLKSSVYAMIDEGLSPEAKQVLQATMAERPSPQLDDIILRLCDDRVGQFTDQEIMELFVDSPELWVIESRPGLSVLELCRKVLAEWLAGVQKTWLSERLRQEPG